MRRPLWPVAGLAIRLSTRFAALSVVAAAVACDVASGSAGAADADRSRIETASETATMAAPAVPATLADPTALPAQTPLQATIIPVAGTPVLWGYVDGAGMAHFATTQVDSRYAQVLLETAGPHVRGKIQGTDSLLTWLEFSPDVKAVQPWLDEAARQSGVDEQLLKAVITVESAYDTHAVSPRGAVGLMQLTPETADRYATKTERTVPAAERLLDARTNILTGARMLADLTRRYGGIDVVLAAWNAGEGTVRRAGGHMPRIAETEAHVHMVLELYWALLQRDLPRHAHGVEVVSCAPACR